jgi:NDP-sugar pyrophosphorylase family protein
MLPATRDVPKVLLPVAGRPFLYHLVTRLRKAGFVDIVLLAGHLAEKVELAALALGHDVSVVRDGPELLGTAGALAAAKDRLAPTFLVTYGDSYLPFDYAGPLRALSLAPQAVLGTMAVWRNEDALEPSNAAIDDGMAIRYDKRREPGEPRLDHIDYGATALKKEALAFVPEGAPAGLDALQAELARTRRLGAFLAPQRFHEIGSPDGLRALEALLSSGRSRA